MTAPAPEAPPAGRKENVFTHKIGPLPMWGWLGIIAAVLIGWRLYSSKNAATSAQQQGASTSTGTDASQVPQFVNQTYVNTTAPAAQDNDTGAGVPTNPSPVGGWPGAQPKPTTTLPGSWHYPAPTGLKAFNISDSGASLSWNAVTGPSGQHPNYYTVATFDSKGKQVDQFGVGAGNTSTKEYGQGGKGLPQGTYHSNVWANGGPVAPPHATVQYTLLHG